VSHPPQFDPRLTFSGISVYNCEGIVSQYGCTDYAAGWMIRVSTARDKRFHTHTRTHTRARAHTHTHTPLCRLYLTGPTEKAGIPTLYLSWRWKWPFSDVFEFSVFKI